MLYLWSEIEKEAIWDKDLIFTLYIHDAWFLKKYLNSKTM